MISEKRFLKRRTENGCEFNEIKIYFFISLRNELERIDMARKCEYCGKGPMVGNNVSHANNKTKRRFLPNLQTLHVEKSGNKKAVRVCSQCIRTGKFYSIPQPTKAKAAV